MNYFKSILTLLALLLILVSCRDSINDPVEEVVEEKPFVVTLKPISYPQERVEWRQGESHEIKWDVTQNLDNVKIVLLKKYKVVQVISESTKNDGNFDWLIPADLPGSHHYRIRLISPYNYGAATTSVEFEIQERESGPIDSK